jgi:hypothetical protein
LADFVYGVAWQQHDPVAFLQAQTSYQRKVWWPAWALRGGIALVAWAILGLVALLSGQRWGTMMFYALLLPLLVQMLCGMLIMITQQAQFWLLYAHSPLVWLLALLWGLTPLASIWVLLGVRVGLPYLAGVLVVDACALWVYGSWERIQRDRQRLRAGGVVSELPTLALWRRVRFVRWMAALGLCLFVGLLFRDGVAALVVLVSCLHLDVSLFTCLLKPPLLQFDQQQGQWRATFAGRSAMFAPVGLVRQVWQSDLPSSEQSAALLALCGQGYLAPVIRRASKELSLEQAHQLTLYLSLQEGGATVIHYLEPSLPQSLRPTLMCYVALAREAAKPLDLQRWIIVLDERLPSGPETVSSAQATAQVLKNVREALLSFTYNHAVMDTALDGLQRLVQSLYDVSLPHISEERWSAQLEKLPLTWPVALLLRLEGQRGRLLAV